MNTGDAISILLMSAVCLVLWAYWRIVMWERG